MPNNVYIDKATLRSALKGLYGTAGHLLKIWFTLKAMGLSLHGAPVEVDTSNSTTALKRLFGCGASDGRFYVPFAHTPRYLTMKHDASRSIIQTTIQRWATSGSVVTCDPTEFLDISNTPGAQLTVAPGRRYPMGLGFGESGFSLEDGTRVSVPLTAFAIWYGRHTPIPENQEPRQYLIDKMLEELQISPTEQALIFVEDKAANIVTRATALSESDVFAACEPFIEDTESIAGNIVREEFNNYTRRIRGMVSGLNLPHWLRSSPETEVKELLQGGTKALLLVGPPRTGKTRAIDAVVPRTSNERCTIQIHDGWGYDYLVEGLRPDDKGNWNWVDGPLKAAIEAGKKFIVLEEINRTSLSQALGEVFSLIEDVYRGKDNAIEIRSGKPFWIPKDVVFFMTMNTIDKSTEDVDDALMGRVASVDFPPSAQALAHMLEQNKVPTATREKVAQLFAEIQTVYALGHGYFVGMSGDMKSADIIRYYKARVRPVLRNFLGDLKSQELNKLDNLVDELFGKS